MCICTHAGMTRTIGEDEAVNLGGREGTHGRARGWRKESGEMM